MSARNGDIVDSRRNVTFVIKVTAALLWLPHFLPLLYTIVASQGNVTRLLIEATILLSVTFVVAWKCSGDWLMVIACVVGLVVESSGFGIAEAKTRYLVPKIYWFLASGLQGVISGILCKAKDVQDGRFTQDYTITERLYIVVPFTLGLWVGYVLMNGWLCIFTVYASVFFSLATVGWCVVLHRIFIWSNVYKQNPVDLIIKIFTTPFGAVFLSLFLAAILIVYLAIPFAQALFSLNPVVGSLGIVGEILVYSVSTSGNPKIE